MGKTRKVVIIGDGAVGSTTAYTILQGEAVNELVIIDINTAKTEGDVLDMEHGMPFVYPKDIKAGNYSDIKGADIIIITAGVAQKPGETRIDLLRRNIKVFDSIIDSAKPFLDKHSIILVVTNPVDILSYYTYQKLKDILPSSHILGSGTVLDTARLKSLLSKEIGVDPRSIHSFVVGEHGDSEVAAFSVTTIGGLSLKDYIAQNKSSVKIHLEDIHKLVKNAAYEIISKKGATYYAVALAVNRIVETILNDQNSILTVSTYLENEFDGQLNGVYLSVPCVVNKHGVSRILRPKYSKLEQEAIIESGKKLSLNYHDLAIV